MEPGSRVYRPVEVARLLGISKTTIYRHIRAHGEVLGVEVIRQNNRIYIPREPIDHLLGGDDVATDPDLEFPVRADLEPDR